MLYDQDTTWKWRAKHKASGKYAQSCHSISPLPPPMHHYRCHMDNKKQRTLINLHATLQGFVLLFLDCRNQTYETTFKKVKLRGECHFLSTASCVLGFHSCHASLSEKFERCVRWNQEGFGVTVSPRVLWDPDGIEPRGCNSHHCWNATALVIFPTVQGVITSHLPVQSYLRCQ